MRCLVSMSIMEESHIITRVMSFLYFYVCSHCTLHITSKEVYVFIYHMRILEGVLIIVCRYNS